MYRDKTRRKRQTSGRTLFDEPDRSDSAKQDKPSEGDVKRAATGIL